MLVRIYRAAVFKTMQNMTTLIVLGLLLAAMGCETGLGRIYGGGVIGNSGGTGAGIGIDFNLDDKQDHRGLFFTENEERLIRNYYRSKRQSPGYAAGPAAGQQTSAARRYQAIRIGEVLPGVEMLRLPVDLEKHLHALPNEFVRIIVGPDIVLLNKPNRVVFDVLADVVL
jgi:hypothetical protein